MSITTRKRAGTGWAIAAVVAALLVVLVVTDGDRSGSSAGDRSDRAPGAESHPESGADATGPATSGGGPGSGPTASAADDAELQHLELGNHDDRQWVYRSETERQAVLRAARNGFGAEVQTRSGVAAGPPPAITDLVPVTGDGPLGSATQPSGSSGLPGPGETLIGTQRVAPGPLPVRATVPEQGIVGRPSQGPARPDRSVPEFPGPTSAEGDPAATGPGH
jgi:hypothetical protein